ncbi:coiled-coil domain-containing protein 66 [Ctenodactylus gundi]
MGNKTKITKCPLRIKQPRQLIKSTQNNFIGNEKLLQKKTDGSETLQSRGEKSRVTFLPTKDLCKQCADKDCLHIQKEVSLAAPTGEKTRTTVSTSLIAKQRPCRKHITAENMNSSLVCLTQDQLQQILMTVNQRNGCVSLSETEKEDEASQDSLHSIHIPNQPKEENITELFQKNDAVSSLPDKSKSNHEASKQYEQEIVIKNEWKPADIFSTLGERERDRSLLEAKKAQWRKELDEQVALKKKEKESSEKWNSHWKKSENDKVTWEKLQRLDQPREAVLLEHALSAAKQEQQRRWTEELNKQTDDRQRKTEGKITYSKGEEHDRWAVHFDSLRSHPGSESQLSSQSAHNQPEYYCISPDTQEMVDVNTVLTPTSGSHLEPSEDERVTKDVVIANSQKTNFLRSMTALLDPAQIEERDRRRQKQLEHQKAITAQVEEKRRRKQLEEEQRKKEEQEEERRLAREREEMQKQYQEDILKQKQKEEIMTLKTNELFQTMQRAQELAQRLKQEQRIRELALKGHDTSRLVKSLGVDTIHVEYNASSNISNSRYDSDEGDNTVNTHNNSATSPKKDTGVQTDDLNTGMFTRTESHCGSVIETEVTNCSSAEFNGQFNNDQQELNEEKGITLEKENKWYHNHIIRTEKQAKHIKKCSKGPDWNISKSLKRYVPASQKYPKQLQKQREEKKVRRQMELLNLVERNNPEHLSQNRGTSPEVLHSAPETESKLRWHLFKKEEPSLNIRSFSKERFQSSPVPSLKSQTQQTQTNILHLPLKTSSFERDNLMPGDGQIELSVEVSEMPHFIPYVRTNEIYYLDPGTLPSRPTSEDQNSQEWDQDQLQLLDSDHVRDPLLNPNLLKNRDRQQAILKGLSELRQGLLQKQKELETNHLPLAANQEENSISF